MDREVYLDNDHLIDYRIQERTTGKFTSDLQLSASLSLNPTGSAATSSFFGPPTTSFTSASFGTSSVTQVTSSGFTESIIFHSSQSEFTVASGSNSGIVELSTLLVETPACSGQYIGVIPGADITTVLSSSFSESFSTEFSSSVVTASQTPTIDGSTTTSLSVTMSVTGSTSSLTTVTELPQTNSPNRCAGVFEIISSGSFLKASTPMNLRSVRFIP